MTAVSSEPLPEDVGERSFGRFPLQSGSREEKLVVFDCALGGRCVTTCEDDVTAATGACAGDDLLDLEGLTKEKSDLAGD